MTVLDADQDLTTAEVAALFRVSTASVLAWADQGLLNSTGRRWRARTFGLREVERLRAAPEGWDFGPDEVMRPDEVARVLGLTVRTVGLWADRRKLVAFRTPGGNRRYSRQQIERVRQEDDLERPERGESPPGRPWGVARGRKAGAVPALGAHRRSPRGQGGGGL